ncbi:MAG: FHA domain-containing protein [Cyanobacteria bacterium SID2]|nr:FHA domain-containing protein [Cyanobacteria bacterium SID2]MBP0006699.1 FHA domain-containing protein [Cyanobacteria bacterium SBC]
MVVCPNCNYQNPENATQCEACFTPLPPSAACPQCGASVPVGASFCGQCGFALPSALSSPSEPPAPVTNGDRATTPTSESPQTVICAETQLQAPVARLVHSDTQAILEIPANLSVVNLGKPNDRVPPDLDLSGFPHSQFVSRIHAQIRVQGITYYIEDVGSANGTYINHNPLARGQRHCLQAGDRIAFGKGDLVTFVFQVV